VSAPHYKP